MNIAFVSPRLHEPGTVGGAETLVWNMALDAVALGHKVELLVTCAKNHFTWENELPAGAFERDGVTVRRFHVNANRDASAFHRVQKRISTGATVTPEEERLWLDNSVNSDAMIAHLRASASRIDRLIAAPYLFGTVVAAAAALPEKTLLAPCLHDEPFARVGLIREMFENVRGFLFNTEPEQQLAHRLYDLRDKTEAVVAMGIEPFETPRDAFAKRTGITGDYLLYSGRREPLKGTPMLIDYLACFRQRTGRAIKLVMTGSGAVDVPTELSRDFHDLGFVSENEKREAMAGALAFCHPSMNESLSIVLLESWLARAPALVRAGSEVLRWQCATSNGGLWFANYPEFETMLLWLLDHPSERAAMAEQGRAYTIAKYAPSAVRARLAAALDS